MLYKIVSKCNTVVYGNKPVYYYMIRRDSTNRTLDPVKKKDNLLSKFRRFYNMKKSIKILLVMLASVLFVASCNATDINMNLQSNSNSVASNVENTTNQNTTENSVTASSNSSNSVLESTQSTKVSSVSSVKNDALGLTNILNILLIVVGVVLILLGIAILIRMHS